MNDGFESKKSYFQFLEWKKDADLVIKNHAERIDHFTNKVLELKDECLQLRMTLDEHLWHCHKDQKGKIKKIGKAIEMEEQ